MGLEHVLRKIHFQDLEIFEGVARLGSVAAAARELRLNSPHISKSIKRIETAAQSIFFKRSKTGVALTPEGRRFLDFSQSLSKLISSSRGFELSEKENTKQKVVTLAGTSYLTTHLLAPAVSKLKSNEDRYRFRLIERSEGELVSSAIKGAFEIAIHTRPQNWPKSWTTVAIGKFSWTLCAKVGHPLGSIANESDVKRYPFVMPISRDAGEVRHGEDQCPLAIRNRISGDEVQTAEVGLGLVSQSQQLIFVPELLAKSRIDAGVLQKIKVRQWHPVIDTLSMSAQGDLVPQRLFEQLIQACEKITI